MQPSEQVGFTGCLARQNRRGRGLKRQLDVLLNDLVCFQLHLKSPDLDDFPFSALPVVTKRLTIRRM
jgi:hypothetical protein